MGRRDVEPGGVAGPGPDGAHGAGLGAGEGPGPPLPEGREVYLPGRGTTLVREVTGPPGAPTVFLLHGITATSALNWFSAFGPLGRLFRVVALDQRGHGGGIATGAGFSLEDCADDVAALAKVLGVERFVVVGYSMGGLVAQLVWHRHRPQVEGLVLCSTDRSFLGAPRTRLMLMAMPTVTAAMRWAPPAFALRADVVGDALIGRPEEHGLRAWARAEMRRVSLATVTDAAVAVARFDSVPWIGGVDVPTAVVVTARDQLLAPRRQLRLAHVIPGATVHMVHGDHGCCVTRPEQYVPVLVEACRSVTGRAALGGGPRHAGPSGPV